MRIDRAITYSVQNTSQPWCVILCVNAAVRDRLYILIHAMIDSNEVRQPNRRSKNYTSRA